jgi:hypothetical protein
VGFEPVITASKRQQNLATGRADTESSPDFIVVYIFGIRITQLLERERQVIACPYTTTLPSSGWVSWHPRRFECTAPFHSKTKTSLCAIVITFRTSYTVCLGVGSGVVQFIEKGQKWPDVFSCWLKLNFTIFMVSALPAKYLGSCTGAYVLQITTVSAVSMCHPVYKLRLLLPCQTLRNFITFEAEVHVVPSVIKFY